MKVVLDTNVVVSGLLQSKGKPARILAQALAGGIQLLHNPQTLAEYAEVLARPRFKFDTARVKEILVKIEMDGLTMDTSGQPELNLPDPDDEPFLAVALSGQADYLVSGNLADYPHDKRRGCKVVSPAEFEAILEKNRKSGK